MEVSHLLHGLPVKKAKIQETGKENKSEVIKIKEVESVKEKLEKPERKLSKIGASHKVIQNLNISDIVGSAESKSPLIEFHFHIHNK